MITVKYELILEGWGMTQWFKDKNEALKTYMAVCPGAHFFNPFDEQMMKLNRVSLYEIFYDEAGKQLKVDLFATKKGVEDDE